MLENVAWVTVREGVELRPGWDALLRGDGAVASAVFDRESRKHPEDPWAWRGLGLAMAEREIEIRAVHSLQRALDIDPDHAETWYWMGQLAPRDTNADLALAALQKAVALQPGEADYHAALAGRLTGDDALVELERALSIDPGHIEALRTSAWALERLGRPGEAIEAAQGLVSRAPSSDHLGELAALLSRCDRPEDAVEVRARQVRRALVERAAPRRLEAFGAVARLLLERRLLENLRGSFAAGAKVSPWEPGFWLGMARAMSESGRSAQALPVLERIVDREPDADIALAVHRERSATLSRLGRTEDARVALELVRMLQDFGRWDAGDPYALAGSEVPSDGFRARWRTWPATIHDPWTTRVQPHWTPPSIRGSEF